MTTKIFYSWQVDTPPRVGRNLIERALQQAVNQLGEDTTIEDVIRDDISIDRDTIHTPGFAPELSPNLGDGRGQAAAV